MVLLALGTVLCATPAVAQVDAVLDIEDEKVTMSEADGGLSGTVTVTNVSSGELGVGLRGLGALEGCVFTPATVPVASARTVEVTFETEDCTVPDNGAPAVLLIDGGEPAEVPVTLTVDSPDPADLSWVPWAFGLALLLSVVTIALVARDRPEVEPPPPVDPAAKPGRKAKAPWGYELPGLGVDWGLSSWASNVTVVATTFAALLGATDVLTVVLGEEPETAVGQILLGGAVALLLLGLAPVLLRIVGPTETPTVTGLLLAAVVTLTGAVGQILSIAWALGATGLPRPLWVAALLLTMSSVAVLLYYGYRTLGFRLKDGVDPPAAGPAPEDLLAAAVLLPMLRPDVTAETWHGALHAIAEEVGRVPGVDATSGYPSGPSLGRPRWTSTGDERLTGVL